jgi:hypothetical protein
MAYLKSFIKHHKEPVKIQVRKHLNADSLFACVRRGLEKIPEHRTGDIKISLPDALMSAFAMFSLKDSSLLAFDERRHDEAALHNLKTVYGLSNVPSDSQMRDICDPVLPDHILPLFRDVFRHIQRGKKLKPMEFMDSHYILALDGTQTFQSKKLTSEACLVKRSRTGEETYYQMMLGAAFVCPGFREVIPLCPEMIVKQDGESKNDCERNAARRFIERYRKEHPHLKTIVVEDALSSNAPHIRLLQEHDIRYILGVKQGDHDFLFQYVDAACETGKAIEFTLEDENDPNVLHGFRFVNGVPLNQSNNDLLVNFLEYWEVTTKNGKEKVQRFSWVTDFEITRETAYQIMRGGRARWKIENETFNTLKNQGYHLEHNFGLGEKYLSTIFTLLMMLAFLIDQAQQLCCPLFRATWQKCKSKRALWENMRSIFKNFLLDSMETIYRMLLHGYERQAPVLLDTG